ncbi:diguanylate cyclase domain-containing protein [Marinobacter sp.]|uniref:sensor domain-containing diguanylate cyclase n=1 Tax=Marinobacter sp. TaxID=50741 RepID=UPI00384CD3AE
MNPEKVYKRWFDSLKNRAVTLVVVAVVLTAVTVTLVNSFVSRQELEAEVRDQMTSLSGLIARELDAKLAKRFSMLSAVAEDLTMDELALTGRAKLLLDRQTTLRQMFNGLYLFDASGTVMAEYPQDGGLQGFDASQREYFRQTAQQMTTLISEPFMGRMGRPLVIMTAPLFDHREKFIGAIGGTIYLGEEDFMGDLLRTRLGQTGYVAMGSRSGLTLVHPRENEVLKPLPASNEVLIDAMKGYEGVRLTTNSQGIVTLTAVRQLDQAPWFLAAVWPEQDALAPARRLTDIMFWVTLGIALVLIPLALLIFRRLMTPLALLSEQITASHLGSRTKPVSVGGGQEIRQVARAFNQVSNERRTVMLSLTEQEAFYRALSESAPIGIVQTDVLGHIEFVNPAFEQIMGWSRDRLRGSHIIHGLNEKDRKQVLRNLQGARVSGRPYQDRLQVRNAASGRMVWIEIMASPITTSELCLGTITVVRDITHEVEIGERLRTEQQRSDRILEALYEGVLLVDRQGVIRHCNSAGWGFLGMEKSSAEVRFLEEVKILVNGKTWHLAEFLEQDHIESLDAVIANRQDENLDVELTMFRFDRNDTAERLVFVLRDVSERRRHEQQLSWQASHDSLTGLLNRRAFNSAMGTWLPEAGRLTTPSVLMLIDLDHFKPVNDRGGHLLGDEMLRQLAGILMQAVRQSDLVARLGGDEFGVLLPACGLERAEDIAENIRSRVEALKLDRNGEFFGVTTSIGVTNISPGDANIREVIARADEACYAAKAQGRNCVITLPSLPVSP